MHERVVGLLVRHLVLPDGMAGTPEVVGFLRDKISADTYINVMQQYRPCYRASDHDELARRITAAEYEKALASARAAGQAPPPKRFAALFMACGIHKPHVPFLAPDKYFAMYPPEELEFTPASMEFWKQAPKSAQTKRYQGFGFEFGNAIQYAFPDAGSDDLLAAVDLHRLYSLSFWDALIVVAAARIGAATLLSEDIQHDRTLAGVRVVNPFRGDPA